MIDIHKSLPHGNIISTWIRVVAAFHLHFPSFLLNFLQVKTRISLCKCNTEERAGQWLSGRKSKKFYIGRKARYVPEKSVDYSWQVNRKYLE